MTRVLLINPPSPEQLGAPLLGLQYVAASSMARGCEVQVIDAAARYFNHDFAWIEDQAEAFSPHIVGFGLFTRWVWHAYKLVERFENRFPLLVSGGAHATVCPDETIERGFGVAVIGEAERAIGQIVDYIEGKIALDQVRGIRFRGSDGSVHAGRPAVFIDDLDSLALPQTAQPLFDRYWYDPSGREAIPGGILTSRGCPARCTFCANYVTGRGFRYRSSANVVAEVNSYHKLCGATFFPCWDDALTANKARLFELCAALENDADFDLG